MPSVLRRPTLEDSKRVCAQFVLTVGSTGPTPRPPASPPRTPPATSSRRARRWNTLAAFTLIPFAACFHHPNSQRRATAAGQQSESAIPPDSRDNTTTLRPSGSSSRAGAGLLANTAEALLANAPRLQVVEVIELETESQVATFTETEVQAVRQSLMAAGLRDTFVNTPAPWPVALRFRADGGAVTAILVGERVLRVNPTSPLSSAWTSSSGQPLPGVREVALDATLYDLLFERLGPPSQEYRPARPIDFLGL